MNLYLLKTDSHVLLEEYLESIISLEGKKITYVYNKNLEEILEEAGYGSLFEEEKYLIVKNADFFGKEKLSEKEEKMLLSYLEHPYSSTTLFFVTYTDLDKRKSLTKKMLEICTYKELLAPKGYELTKEVQKRMQGFKVNDAVIKFMIDSSLSQFDLICNEIEKLSLLYKKGDTILLKDIKAIVPPNLNENIFKFTDAVIEKNATTAFRYLKEFEQVKVDPLQLLNLLVREFRLLLYYKIYEKKGYSFKDIQKELKLQEWQVQKIMRNASLFHVDDLKSTLVLLAHMDYKIKSGQEDKNMSMYTFLTKYFA